MKKGIPWFLLALSLAFNAFFLVGMFSAHWRPHDEMPPPIGPEGRVAFLARKLDLDDTQKTAFLDLEKKFQDKWRTTQRGPTGNNFHNMLEEIAKDEPDDKVIDKFVQDDFGSGHRRMLVDHLRAMMLVLRPDQRKKAIALFRHGPGRGGPMGRGGRGKRGPGGPGMGRPGPHPPKEIHPEGPSRQPSGD